MEGHSIHIYLSEIAWALLCHKIIANLVYMPTAAKRYTSIQVACPPHGTKSTGSQATNFVGVISSMTLGLNSWKLSSRILHFGDSIVKIRKLLILRLPSSCPLPLIVPYRTCSLLRMLKCFPMLRTDRTFALLWTKEMIIIQINTIIV